MATDQSVVAQEAQPRAGMHGTDRPLADIYRTALIDLDGVVYRGSAAVPFAADALARWREHGLRTVFLTNNASRTPAQVAELLGGLGIATTTAEVVTSAQVAAGLAADAVPRGSRVLVVGGVATEIAVAERGLAPVRSAADAPAAVVQGFAPEVDWRQLAEATYAVDRGIPWFATNMDLVVPRGPGNAPGNGTLINAIRTVTKRDPVVGGKPHPPMYAEAFRRGPGPYLMVGDGLETDIEGARGMGLDSMLVLTGVTSIGELAAAPAHRRPTFLAADLRGLLSSQPVIRHERRLSWQCGAWTASAANSVIALQRAAPGPLASTADLADGARALCQAAWDRTDAGVQASAEHAASLVAGELEKLKQTYSANTIGLVGRREINGAGTRRGDAPTTYLRECGQRNRQES